MPSNSIVIACKSNWIKNYNKTRFKFNAEHDKDLNFFEDKLADC